MARLKVPTISEMMARNERPDVLFWVGCAGSFDQRAQKITRAFAGLLIKADVSFAVLGTEESCSGDPAKRAGNEYIFQMQAMENIKRLNSYNITKIVTACPHCFNTLKNEYPALGGDYKVYHHTEFIHKLLGEGKLKVQGGQYKGKRITFHDPCYLGRANSVYEIPRELLQNLDAELIEMKSCKSRGLCCGAGGAQMFKEPEKGTLDINAIRVEEAKKASADIVATACPFCNTMLTDGVNAKQLPVPVLDVVELLTDTD